MRHATGQSRGAIGPLATEQEWQRGRQVAPVAQRKYLLFMVGEQDYAIEIRRIREIIRVRPPTEVPRVPPFVLGVVSVRGLVLPVIDLALRLGIRSEPWSPPEIAGARTDLRYLIVAREEERFGLLVDRVRQVVHLEDDRIEPPPPMFSGDDFIAGIGRPRKETGAPVELMLLLHLDLILRFDFARRPGAVGEGS